jgi:hypothetical protein
MNSNEIEIVVNNTTLKWYREKGYEIPTHKRQLWANKNGERLKNGTKEAVAKSTKIVVKINDLPPASSTYIKRVCTSCKNEFGTSYYSWVKKEQSDRCTDCAKKKIKGDGSHCYWVGVLITNNKDAICDISGEKDKRFLVLHHLDSRAAGGRNTLDNYVVLSANYHLAFHNWIGGMQVRCKKEQYYEFKKQELL